MSGPPDDDRSMLSRDELLRGLSGRRIASTLYLLESRTAYLALQARHATVPPLSEHAVEEQDRAFLATLAAGRDLARPPSIQELEQFAPQWAHLVPAGAVDRAVLAQRLDDKYRFRAQDVPRLRVALGLDDPAVREAYRGRLGADLDAVYDTDLSRLERWQWTRARLSRRLEELPPFWTAYGLSLTAMVGAGMLAMPIVTASVGALPGVVIILVIGLLNVLTVAAVAEAFTRTAAVRWGGAFFGRVVRGYLGQEGSAIFSLVLFFRGIPVLLACYLGFASNSEQVTHIPGAVWAALLFVLNVALIYRRRLDLTIATALLIGIVNVTIIMVLVALALHLGNTENLEFSAIPVFGNHPFELRFLDGLLGVVMLSYYGHIPVGNCAQLVLRRDPGGRSLIGGSAAATLTAVVLYSGWVVVVSSAVPHDRLAVETGTALAPLDDVIGPIASVLGFVFIFLALGMNSVHVSMGVYNLVAERFPPRVGRLAGFTAVAGILGAAEILLLNGRSSFASTLGFVGAITGPVLGVVFPVLLLVGSRRRGECPPARAWGWVGHPVVAAFVFAVFFAIQLMYAWIWAWPQKVISILAVVTSVLLAVLLVRRGSLRPRAVVEVRRDVELGRDRLEVVAAGRTVRSEQLPPGTLAVSVELGSPPARDLKVWGHEVDPGGGSTPMAVSVSLRDGSGQQLATPTGPDGEVTMPLDGPESALEVTWPRFTPGARR